MSPAYELICTQAEISDSRGLGGDTEIPETVSGVRTTSTDVFISHASVVIGQYFELFNLPQRLYQQVSI